MKSRSGFTLIEVLIVVTILGILATLIIPRFLTAPEKAMVAEANHMLGALNRAQQVRLDTGLPYLNASPLVAANWSSLGINTPGGTSKFTYGCTSPVCSATRTVNSTASTAAINATTQAWTCTGAYTRLSQGGCTLV